MRRIVIIGASSAIATHCARKWVEDDAIDMLLVGRNTEKLERVAADLQARSPQSVFTSKTINFQEPTAIKDLVSEIYGKGGVNTVLIAHGSLPDQSQCERDLAESQNALMVNGVSPILFAEAFAERMTETNQGTIAIIGSVAGDRGRKSNYVYGAAKGMVERYVEGMQHRFAGTPVKIVLIKPGPTDTPMTAHLKAQGVSLALVEDVAAKTVSAINSGKPITYAPTKWWLIMNIIRKLPRFIFHRLNI